MTLRPFLICAGRFQTGLFGNSVDCAGSVLGGMPELLVTAGGSAGLWICGAQHWIDGHGYAGAQLADEYDQALLKPH